jgi:site-specific DNA-methyltransferase (adenine-specific)
VGTPNIEYGDSGGASRFFYCAKAPKSEKGTYNTHPTVKPLTLMEYLCKLTKTPTGGLVLDPFTGSATTGVACLKTGRDFIGIEKDESYYAIAVRRLEEASA